MISDRASVQTEQYTGNDGTEAHGLGYLAELPLYPHDMRGSVAAFDIPDTDHSRSAQFNQSPPAIPISSRNFIAP